MIEEKQARTQASSKKKILHYQCKEHFVDKLFGNPFYHCTLLPFGASVIPPCHFFPIENYL